jgi:hypothetical protein
MKTFYNEAAILWHQQILEHNTRADPIKYRPQPTNLSKAWRNKTESLSERFHPRDVPKLVPSYNPNTVRNTAYGTTQRALLFALKAGSDPNFTPITSDDHVVILDSGCSIAITPDLSDFIDGTYASQAHNISGIGSGLQSHGIGEVSWTFQDRDNKPVTMKLTCLHVPDIPCRLLPPQQIAQQGNSTLPEGAWLGKNSAAKVFFNGHVIDFPYDTSTNLPLKKLSPGCTKYCTFLTDFHSNLSADTQLAHPQQPPSLKNASTVPSKAPTAPLYATIPSDYTDNLSVNQRTLLRLHHRFGHRSFQDIQAWSRAGRFNIPIEVSTCKIPICLACKFGDAKKNPHNGATHSVGPANPNPGDFVSVDTLEAGIPGYIPFTNGKPSNRRYTNSTVWVDQASKNIWVDHQETKTGKETLQSKIRYEKYAARYHRELKHIHSDNGIFAKSEFVTHCQANNQTHTFCGVGAHWQNGVVERYIGHLTSRARTMLLHAMRHWPTMITPTFWPYAISHAARIHNHSPRRGQTKSPCELFTDETDSISPNDFHVFGCPVFVLAKELQDGKSMQKFSRARSYMGIYVGQSPHHASNVALIFNPKTQLVSPQYHVVFDEDFETVASSDPAIMASNIALMSDQLFQDHEWIHTDDFTDPEAPEPHRYFDDSWDISRIYEDLRKRQQQSTKQLARLIQKNSCLRKELGIPKYQATDISESPALPLAKNPLIDTMDTNTSVETMDEQPQASEGVSTLRTWTRNRPRTKKHRSKPRARSRKRSRSDSNLPISEGAPDIVPTDVEPSEGVKLPSPASLETNQTSPVPTGTSDEPYTRNKLPVLSSDTPPGDLLHVISQLCSAHTGSDQGPDETSNPLLPALNQLTSLLSAMTEQQDAPEIFTDESSAEKDFEAICDILDQRNILHDGVSLEGIFEIDDPFSFAAGTKNNPDVLSRSQMMKADDRDKFLSTEPKEIQGLIDAGVFSYLPISDIPPDRRRKLLNAIWSYRRKRRPDGTLLKYKCRICADGSQQRHGIDYWETYSPVVQWSTVRLIMVLAATLDLKSRQVDYQQAFPQAPIDEDVYMRIPEGWAYDCSTKQLVQVSDVPAYRDHEFAIKLEKNLYGCKQASRNWYLHLKAGLERRGFAASTIDPCLFIRDNCLICLYTDDCCIFAHDDTIIDDLIKELADDGFLLTDEGDIEDFLGVHVERLVTDNQVEITMTQTGLIDSIITDLGLDASSAKHEKHDTPAVETLQPDLDQLPFSENWGYRSVIGKLNFLAQNTRPDLSFAVHQCAKFCMNPRTTHGAAVKRIGRYLKTTRDKGITLRPDGTNSLNAYVDADFCGTWIAKNANLRGSALSRTGFVLTYSNCPVFWLSKLQTEIALSTCEAEYIALSQCARQLIPIRNLLNELTQLFKAPNLTSPLCSGKTLCINKLADSVILEDNSAALTLAMDGDKYRPRTKHLSIKWHHFRDQVEDGWLTVKKVASKDNWADIFTKPLPKPQFCLLRDELMGWSPRRIVPISPPDGPVVPEHAAAAYAHTAGPRKRRRKRR